MCSLFTHNDDYRHFLLPSLASLRFYLNKNTIKILNKIVVRQVPVNNYYLTKKVPIMYKRYVKSGWLRVKRGVAFVRNVFCFKAA